MTDHEDTDVRECKECHGPCVLGFFAAKAKRLPPAIPTGDEVICVRCTADPGPPKWRTQKAKTK